MQDIFALSLFMQILSFVIFQSFLFPMPLLIFYVHKNILSYIIQSLFGLLLFLGTKIDVI